MIGQKSLIEQLEKIYSSSNVSFYILVGNKGMGKRTISKEFAKGKFDFVIELPDVSVDTIRKTIKEAYTIKAPTLYIIPDAQRMSVNARNAILKVTEEPPNNAHFIMTITSSELIMDTLKSRAVTFYMRPYFREELAEYMDGLNVSDKDKELMAEICSNIYEIDLMCQRSAQEYYKFAKTIIDNIVDISVPNMLKSNKSIAFKEGDDGLDFDLVMKTICFVIRDKMNEKDADVVMYNGLISQTMLTMWETRTPSVSKSNSYDTWFLECRRIIKECEKRGHKHS